jgi:transcriptional regulator with XRE-family HTH domain
MEQSAEQKRLLATFLRAHRERLSPQQAGIQGGSLRRRTPGLRREEVAHLCGMSPTWYTWLEQARPVSVSPQALARIAAALHLTPAERAYLFELTGKRDPDAPSASALSDPPGWLVAMLEAITAPAYLLDPLWNAVASNAPGRGLFVDWLTGPERNLLRYVFLDRRARAFIGEWEVRARRLIAEFRADTASRTNAPDFRAFLQEMRRSSPAFARFWDDQGVLEREGGMRTFNHPTQGYLCYRQVTLHPAGTVRYKLVALVGDEKHQFNTDGHG